MAGQHFDLFQFLFFYFFLTVFHFLEYLAELCRPFDWTLDRTMDIVVLLDSVHFIKSVLVCQYQMKLMRLVPLSLPHMLCKLLVQ